MSKLYRYYCKYRPPAPGAVPRGAKECEFWDARPFVGEIGCHAWGYVEYDHPLDEKEIADYELAPAALNPN